MFVLTNRKTLKTKLKKASKINKSNPIHNVKGTVSWDFLLHFFFLNMFILVPLEMSLGHFDFVTFLSSYCTFKMTDPVLWKLGCRNSLLLWKPGSHDSPVSKVPGSCTFAKGKNLPGFQSTRESWLAGVQSTCRYFGNQRVVLLFMWTFKPMLLALKQH